MKILLVDDHALFRAGVALLLGHEFAQWQVLQVGSLNDAIDSLTREPDIALVLLDLRLPDSEGLAGLVRLRLHAPRPRYVVVSGSDGEKAVLEAIENGAAGFIPKTSSAGAMLAALRTVVHGGVALPSPMCAAGPVAALVTPPEPLGLSARQGDVLRLLIEGKSNKGICSDLGIAESTVKTHLVTIFRKLDVTSRTQAVAASARLGMPRHAAHMPA
jgi:DNA-binding NarL/FixJ family response regulator